MIHRFLLSTCVLVAFGLVLPATVASSNASATEQSATATPFAPELPRHIRQQIYSNSNSWLVQTTQRLFRINPRGVVTRDDFSRFQKVEQAKVRGRFLVQYLQFDLNGDGVLSAEEKREVEQFEAAQRRSQIEVLFLKGDKDGDGNISYSELTAYLSEQNKVQNQHASRRNSDIFLFDLNQDNKVTVQELADFADKIASEPKQVRQLALNKPRIRHRETPATKVQCKLPSPSQNAEVLLVGGRHGTAIPAVSVAGQDFITTTASLSIEPGDKPLYIVSQALSPVIWQVAGAIERVEKFVVQPSRVQHGGGAGVIGLDQEKVYFTPTLGCIPQFSNSKGGQGRIAAARLGHMLARPVTDIIAHTRLGQLKLPSGSSPYSDKRTSGIRIQSGNDVFQIEGGKVTKLYENEGNNVARELLRKYPDGIVDMKVKDVLSPKTAERYEILPGQAGLVQLMKEGAIERTKDGFILIKKDIKRYPTGLFGGQTINFIIAKGVKAPGGDPGRSRVYLEETGECIAGIRCQ